MTPHPAATLSAAFQLSGETLKCEAISSNVTRSVYIHTAAWVAAIGNLFAPFEMHSRVESGDRSVNDVVAEGLFLWKSMQKALSGYVAEPRVGISMVFFRTTPPPLFNQPLIPSTIMSWKPEPELSSREPAGIITHDLSFGAFGPRDNSTITLCPLLAPVPRKLATTCPDEMAC